MRKNCKTYGEWLLSQYQEFINLESDHLHWVRDNHGSTSNMVIYHTLKDKQGRASFKRETICHLCDGNPEGGLYYLIGAAWAAYKGEEIPRKFNREKVQIGTLKAGDKFYTESGTECFVIGAHPLSNYHYITVDATYPNRTKTYEAVQYVYVDR